MKIDIRKFYWNWLWLGIFAIGFGIFLIVTPKYIDDYWYSWHLKDWFDSQGIWYLTDGGNIFKYGIPWEGLRKTIEIHVLEDTSRLCNMLGPFMLLFPKWVGSSISWLCLLYSVRSCFRLANVDINRSWLVAVGIGMWTLTFFWYEAMGTVIYQYNYIVSTALSLGVLNSIMMKPRSIPGMTGFVVLCIITSLWHEGFATPLFVSLLVMLILFKDWRNRWVFIAAVIMLLGLIWHFSQPGLSGRLQIGWFGISPRRFLRQLYYHRAMWVALAVMICYLFRFGFRCFFTDRILVFMIAGTVAVLGISYYTDIARASWWGDVASVIMTLEMLRKMEGDLRKYLGWRTLISSLILGMSYFELVGLDIHTVMFAREYPEILANYLKDPKKTQFSHLEDYPWIGPLFSQMIYPRIYKYNLYVEHYYGFLQSDGNGMKVVPEGLRNIRMEECTSIEGDLNAVKYGPYIVAETDELRQKIYFNTTVDYGGFVTNSDVELMPFVSEGDGRKYDYIFIWESSPYSMIEDIKGIRYKEEHPEPWLFP